MGPAAGKPKIDFDRVFLAGKYKGMTVREMLLVSYTDEPNGCWRWTRSITNKGYGQFGYWIIDHKGNSVSCMYQAHRAFAEMFGINVDGSLVLHSCDNPWCVNPSHLRAGSLQDNMDDKVARGRVFRPLGENHPMSVLAEADVLDIRKRAACFPRKQLAKEYGITSQLVGRIVRGDRWKHLPLHPQ